MGVIGDSISTVSPSVGDAEPAASAAAATLLAEFKTRLTSKIGVASIQIDGDLDMNSNPITELTYAQMVTQTSDPGNESVYTKAVSGIDELHYIDSGGSVVQITDNGGLNVAATGAITGAGYGSSGVALNWNSAGFNYQFKSGSGADDYAQVTCAGVQFRDGSSHAINMAAPSLAADYTYTLPTSDGHFKMFVPGSAFLSKSGSTFDSINVTTDGVSQSATQMVPLILPVGRVIDSIELHSSNDGGTTNFDLRYVNTSGTRTDVATTSSSGLLSSIAHTVLADVWYNVYVTWGGSQSIYGIEITFSS